MRYFKSICTCLCVSTFLAGHPLRGQADFSWNYEPRFLGSATFWGHAYSSYELGTLSLSRESIPLKLIFTTDPRISTDPNSAIGSYWSIQFFESKIFPISRQTLRWSRPDGRIFLFAKENLADKRRKESYKSVDGTWKAKETDRNEYELQHIRTGCTLRYTDGNLTEFSWTSSRDRSDFYRVSYNSVGKPQALRNSRDVRPILEFSYDRYSGMVDSIILSTSEGSQRIEMEYENYELLETPDAPLLSKLVVSEGETYQFSYEIDSGNRNAIYLGEKRSTGGSSANQKIAWEPLSGFLTDDGVHSYKISNKSIADAGRELGYSKAKRSPINWLPSYAKINRIEKHSSIKDSVFYDTKRGVMERLYKDGGKVVTYYLLSPGRVNGKVRKIEKYKDGELVSVERNAYDKAGRIIRRIDVNGDVTRWDRSADGKYVTVFRNEQIFSESFYINGALIAMKRFTEDGIKTSFSSSAEAKYGDEISKIIPRNFISN